MNSIEEIIEPEDYIVAEAARHWARVLPDQPLPDEGDLYRWLYKANGNAGVLHQAIEVTGARSRVRSEAGDEMSGDDCNRYLTSTIIQMDRERHSVGITTSLTKRGNGDRMTVRATGHAMKRRSGIL